MGAGPGVSLEARIRRLCVARSCIVAVVSLRALILEGEFTLPCPALAVNRRTNRERDGSSRGGVLRPRLRSAVPTRRAQHRTRVIRTHLWGTKCETNPGCVTAGARLLSRRTRSVWGCHTCPAVHLAGQRQQHPATLICGRFLKVASRQVRCPWHRCSDCQGLDSPRVLPEQR
jgi:hypothetical protein